ncbi:radical SAM protein [Geoglobus sp.]
MQFLRLAERVLLRKFGKRLYAYNAETDELYELDDEAFNFLLTCDGRAVEVDAELLDFLLSEGLVELNDGKTENSFVQQEEPSLRYMLVNVTWRCNLKCAHCFVHQENAFMDHETFKSAVDQFYDLGGLKVMVSGGEPLLHPEIWDLLEYARQKPFRIVLLTNGYLVDGEKAERISELADEVQISLDGIDGHRKLRGLGWEKVVRSIELLAERMDVSVSTMVTKYNLNEFERLERILENAGVKRWTVDVPTTEKSLIPPFEKIAEILGRYGFGDLGHVSEADYACGAHYCEVNPDGRVVKCGFFEESVGHVVEDGLGLCWERMKERFIWKLDMLKCNCEFLEECKGGCRYRALVYSGHLFACDPVMCSAFGISCRTI